MRQGELRDEVGERVRLLAGVDGRPRDGWMAWFAIIAPGERIGFADPPAPRRRVAAPARRRDFPSARWARVQGPRDVRGRPRCPCSQGRSARSRSGGVPKNGSCDPETSIGPPQPASMGTSANVGNIRWRSRDQRRGSKPRRRRTGGRWCAPCRAASRRCRTRSGRRASCARSARPRGSRRGLTPSGPADRLDLLGRRRLSSRCTSRGP